MRFLVIGGTGLLGTSLIRTLIDEGHDVLATHLRRPAGPAPASWVRLDLRDPQDCAAAIQRAEADVVINAAYVPGGDDLRDVVELAPGMLATSALAVGSRFVHVSTDVVFPGDPDHHYIEADPADPVHDYGRAKAGAEVAVRTANPDATVVRTSLLYGGVNPTAQEGLVTRAATEGDITFFTDEVRSPVEVGDLSTAMLGLVDKPGLWHLTGADPVDRLTFARLLAPSVGIDPDILRGAPMPTDGPRRPAHVVLDCSKAAAIGVEVPGVLTRLGG